MPENKEDKRPVCGLVMPISELDGCSESHWSDVYQILSEAVDDAGFESNLVSNADDVGIIQKRIIENLYDNPVVICDVSGKNPNVMFELGLRLAFDKPTIIVKDDKTSYSFDTAPIEHLEYPRDLRFAKIVEFKLKLANKIKKTYEKSTTDHNYTTFLKNFGEFKVAKIEKKEVPGQEFILDELKNLRSVVSRLEPRLRAGGKSLAASNYRKNICLKGASEEEIQVIADRLFFLPEVIDYTVTGKSDHKHIKLEMVPGASSKVPAEVVRKEFPHVGMKPRLPPPVRKSKANVNTNE
jgi:hypothetical protein